MGSVHPHKGPATRPRVGAAFLSLLAANAVLLLGCGSDGGGADPTTSSSASAGAKAVTIEDYIYKPASITLEESGTFAYYCLFHPFMKGTIVVE